MLPLSNPIPEPPLHLRDRLLAMAHASRRRFATIAAGGLVCVVAFHVVFGANGLTAYEAKRRQNAELAQKITELQLENDRIADHNVRLQHSETAIEEAIRKHLHFARTNEVILTVPSPTPPQASAK